MVTQRSELIDAGRVKRILEEVTGDEYVLKTRAQLIHPDDESWYLHLPVGAAGYVHNAYEADGRLVFKSSIVYEVYQDMEHEFSESKYIRLRERLGDDVDHLQDREIRQNYRKMIPHVVGFFDKVEEILSRVNQEQANHVSLLNDSGSISVGIELETVQAEKDDTVIRRSILAMKEALVLIVDWQNEEQTKDIHVAGS